MKSAITSRGKTVIPAEIRRRFKLDPRKKIEWIVDQDGIRVVPVLEDPEFEALSCKQLRLPYNK